MEFLGISNDQLLIKFVFSCIIFISVYLLYKYTKPLANDEATIVNYYKIHSNFDLYLSFFILFIYSCIFIVGIFLLSIFNMKKEINLKEIATNIINFYYTNSLLVIIINSLFILLLILIYLVIFIKLLKIFKRYIIKLHLYFNTDDIGYWYTRFHDTFRSDYNISYRVYPLYIYIPLLRFRPFGSFILAYHLVVLSLNLHYIIIFFTFLYDIFYNDYTIQYTYKILPYIFFYHVYIRCCRFYQSLSYGFMIDYYIHQFMYSNDVIVINNDTEILLDDGLPLKIEDMRNIIFVYLRFGLNGYIYDKYTDPEGVWKLHTYNYIKDWEYRKHF